MNYQRPKGTADILPGQSERWQQVEAVARKIFAQYQYREIRTPIFENVDVFSRSAGDTSDIVTKEMYTFEDKGDRMMALRPEGTAGVVRAYVENKLYGPEYAKPYKVYYMGPMFRYERPQSGRQRQFHQIGVEAFGSDSPVLDAETLALAKQLLEALGAKHLKFVINSLGDPATRKAFHAALVAPSILDYLTPEAQQHFDRVKSLLTGLGIEFEVDATMVRGLDYYNHTIFEVMSDDKVFGGGYTTILAGGRYNGLVEELGGPETPGIGFAMGVERLMLLMQGDQQPVQPDAYIVTIDQGADQEALQMLTALRQQGFTGEMDYMGRKAKGQFKAANKANAKLVLTIGESERAAGTVQVKNMATGQQKAFPQADVLADFSKIYTQVTEAK